MSKTEERITLNNEQTEDVVFRIDEYKKSEEIAKRLEDQRRQKLEAANRAKEYRKKIILIQPRQYNQLTPVDLVNPNNKFYQQQNNSLHKQIFLSTQPFINYSSKIAFFSRKHVI